MRKRRDFAESAGCRIVWSSLAGRGQCGFEEVTSEENDYPIEFALLGAEELGWRAAIWGLRQSG